jgi:hypothetical protein
VSAREDLQSFGRFLVELPAFLKNPITLEQAQAAARRRLATRESSFLRIMERGVYGYPRSPYLPLLRRAGCQLGDVHALVRDRGLEGALRALRAEGVYVGFEEFKGRRPIVRPGLELAVRPNDFDNPHLRAAYYTQSGGSTGVGTRIGIDLGHAAVGASRRLLTFATHGLVGAPTVVWRGVLPDGSATTNLLFGARMGNVPRHWFTPLTAANVRLAPKHRLATRAMVLVARASGVPMPWPEPLPLDRADVVARCAAATLRAHGRCLVSASVSLSLRVALAARERGIDLGGAAFFGGGEPPTPAKVRGIVESGARWVPNYFISEMGQVGAGCGNPIGGDDLHFLQDILALVTYPRRVPGAELTVDSFHFTSLSPTAPKLMLNLESDDYGVIERRACGCPLEQAGFAEHLREVRSFSKLTGEGVTLVGSEMVQVLEEVLPARFGGSPLDYQLAEEEDERGFTRLSLVMSPRLGPLDEAEVAATLLAAVGTQSLAADMARAIWGQAGSLRVVRREPASTGRGKLLPLHLAQRAAEGAGRGADGKGVESR